MFNRLLIPRAVLDAVIAHARTELPRECCGLLAGVLEGELGHVTQHFPVRNDLASPTEYATNPRDMLTVARAMRAAGTDVLAIYHSHPTSDPVPSSKDVERNTYGEYAAHLIVGLAGATPDVRVWWLAEAAFRPAEWGIA